MLNAFLYKKDHPLKTDLSRAQMLAALNDKDSLLWIDLEDANDFESDCLVEIFNFHDLAVEDCIMDNPQPKVDDYEEYLFLAVHTVKMIQGEDKKRQLISKELNMFLGRNYVVTYHKNPVSCLGSVREITRKKPDQTMGHGADMLAHKILDQLVDNYQPVLDEFDQLIDHLEDEIFNHPAENYLTTIMQVKQDVFHLRRLVAPQRDALNLLTRNPTVFIKSRHLMYFRDVYDHLFRIYGLVEGFHDNITGILQAYFSFSSHRLNQTIQRMTVMATLSMPAIMIASIYGMNFQHMPELNHPYGYLFSLALMGLLSLGLLGWMKWKKWI